MKDFRGETLSWNVEDGIIELVLDRAPCNEIGSTTLTELERFTAALELLQKDCHALIISSPRAEGFCAGADLRELYHRSQALPPAERVAGVREFVSGFTAWETPLMWHRLRRLRRYTGLLSAADLSWRCFAI